MSPFARSVRRHGLEALILLLALESLVEIAIRRNDPSAPRTALWFTIPALAVMVLPLFGRRRFPCGAPMAYWLLAAAFSYVDGRLVTFMTSTFLLGMTAAYLLGNLRDARQAGLGLAVVLGSALVVVYNEPTHTTSTLVFVPTLFGTCWLAGFALRQHAEQAEAAEVRATRAEWERDAATRIAVAEERVRIARELHDVVAHAVSVMVLQVGAVRHRLPDALADDREALEGVEVTGRRALAEMRRLLGAMRRDDDEVALAPAPGLGNLDALAAEVRRAGLPVRLHVDESVAPIPPALDVSAYRIIQEGLTNALKHARASQADVTVRYGADELRIEVRDNGAGAVRRNGGGHGLLGVAERVKIYGGEMSAGTVNGGGFALRARLPFRGQGS